MIYSHFRGVLKSLSLGLMAGGMSLFFGGITLAEESHHSDSSKNVLQVSMVC